MPEKKLVIDVEVKKKTTGSTGKVRDEDDPKVSAEREKQANKEKLENLKSSLKQKQSLLDSDIKRQQSLLDHAKQMELEAERQGNREKIKEMIAFRRLMESQLRVMEADMRLLRSKDLAEFKSNLKEKERAQKQYDREIKNAPRTKLAGDIGSEAYYKQVANKQAGMLPGSEQFIQTGSLLNRYRAQLTASGVDVRSLSQKIGGEFKTALDSSSSSITNQISSLSKQALGYYGVTMAITQAISLARQSVTAYGEQEDALLQLQAVTHGNTEQYNRLVKLSEESQKKFGIPDEQIESLLAYAVAQGRGEEMMQKMIKAARIMSIVNKTDFAQSFKDVDKTLEGNVKQYGKMEQDFKHLTKEQLENGAAVDLILSKYQDLGNAVENSASTKMKIAETNVSEFKEGLGEAIVQSIIPGVDAFNALGISSSQAGKIIGQSVFTGVTSVLPGLTQLINKVRETGHENKNLKANLEEFKNRVPVFGHAVQFLALEFTGLSGEIDGSTNSLYGLITAFTALPDFKKINTKDPMNDPANQGTKDFSVKTKSPGSKQHKEEKDAIDELLKSIDLNIKQQELQLKLEGKKPGLISDTIKKELLRLEAVDRTNLKQEQLVRLLEKEVELRDKLSSFIAKGLNAESPDARSERQNPRGKSTANANEQGSEDNYFRKLQEIQDNIGKESLNAFTQSLSLVQQIDQVLGGGAAEVIQAFQTAYSITQAIVELINTIDTITGLLDFIPGAGALKAIPGLAGGGRTIAGAMYEWNENGKELFIPTASGYVLDAKKFGAFSSSISEMSSFMARDRDTVGSGFAASVSNRPIVQIQIKNPIDFRKAFETSAIEAALRNNATMG
ncbi:MAG: hypothetical protein HOP31_08830 [Ignavibacteria bacterium]|nr:hypothetical protein [Ignavibacteria bacterium]